MEIKWNEWIDEGTRLKWNGREISLMVQITIVAEDIEKIKSISQKPVVPGKIRGNN